MISTIFLLIVSVSTLIIARNNNENCLATTEPKYPCDELLYYYQIHFFFSMNTLVYFRLISPHKLEKMDPFLIFNEKKL